MRNNKLDEIIVIVGDDGNPKNSISKKTFYSYKLLGNNKMKIIEKSFKETILNIQPYNQHALRFVKKWLS